METVLLWLPYWLLGLSGIVGHVMTKIPQGTPVGEYFRANSRDIFFSVGAYHILLFFWIDSGIEFVGMVKNTPNGLTFMLGWFGQSVLGHLIKQFETRIQKKEG